MFVFRAAVALLCIGLLVSQCDPTSFMDLIASVNMWLIAAVGTSIVCWLISGWLSLFVLVGLEHTSVRGFVDYSWIQALSGFTPGRAGELFIPVALQKDSLSTARLLGALVVQRMSNIAIILLTLGVIMAERGQSWIAASIFVLTLGGGAMVILSAGYLRRIVPKRWPKMDELVFNVHYLIETLPKRIVALHALLVGFRFFTNTVTGYMVFRALGLQLPIGDFVAGVSLAALVTLIPISVAGLGISEAILWKSLEQFGLTVEIALTGSLIARVLLAAIPMCVGSLCGFLEAVGKSNRPFGLKD
jgi:uncharacterized membrane protein YbhN (UPF0104 family)